MLILVFFYIFNIEEGTLFLKDSRFIEASKEGVRVELDLISCNRAYREGIRELIIDKIISIVDMFSREVIVL